jgi:hypothetical protein
LNVRRLPLDEDREEAATDAVPVRVIDDGISRAFGERQDVRSEIASALALDVLLESVFVRKVFGEPSDLYALHATLPRTFFGATATCNVAERSTCIHCPS